MATSLEDAPQRSDAWFAARLGKVTASRVGDVMATTKSGPSASRKNYMAELVAERLTGKPAERFQSAAMAHGTEAEPQARRLYEFLHDVTVEEVGFLLHPSIPNFGASPDGLVGADGLVEIKAPNTATHIDTLLGAPIDRKYLLQMQVQMSVTDRAWCDFVSFDPRLPAEMQLFVQRVPRDDALIMQINEAVTAFLVELGRTVGLLSARYGVAQRSEFIPLPPGLADAMEAAE